MMTTTKLEVEGFFQLDTFFYYNQISQVTQHIEPQLKRTLQSYVWFNLFFLFLIVGEVLALFAFFTFFIESSLLAFGLGGLLLTCFSYFTLRAYLQAKKPEQLETVCDRYITACRSLVNYQEGIPEHHVALANACSKFASNLAGKEYRFYQVPNWLGVIAPMMEKFSCWFHWYDIHQVKELMLVHAIDEYTKLAKCEPTSLEVHTALANAYVMLSGIYVDPRKIEGDDEDRVLPFDQYADEFKEKFRIAAERAIEEFKILNDYAPHDPWVHVQLAYSYHDLQMPEEEIREYETVLDLCPEDPDTLFKLGTLYFQQGLNAQGLRIYEKLKDEYPKKAENLITYYGAYHADHFWKM